MKITYTRSVPETVELTKKQMAEVTIATLEKHFDLKRLDRVKDGKLEREIEYHGHRAYWEWEVQRNARKSDEHVLRLIGELFEKANK